MLSYYVSHSLTSTAIYSGTHSRIQLHEKVRRFQLRDSSKTMIRRQLIRGKCIDKLYRRIGIISSHTFTTLYLLQKIFSYLECQSNRHINSLIPFSRNTSQFSNLAHKLIIAVSCLRMTNCPKEGTTEAE